LTLSFKCAIIVLETKGEKMTNKFAEGDKVKAVEVNPANGKNLVGVIGIVDEVDVDGDVWVRYDGKFNSSYYRPEHLKKLDEECVSHSSSHQQANVDGWPLQYFLINLKLGGISAHDSTNEAINGIDSVLGSSDDYIIVSGYDLKIVGLENGIRVRDTEQDDEDD